MREKILLDTSICQKWRENWRGGGGRLPKKIGENKGKNRKEIFPKSLALGMVSNISISITFIS